MEQLYGIYRDLLAETPSNFLRYMHDAIDWQSRLVVLMGARGVGKTTLVLQHIKLHGDPETSLYVDANHTYFAANSLYDVAQKFRMNGGKTLYIDEVHKYANWSREVKMMYDYLSDLQVVVTGSSMLDIKKGTDADLSRRAITYTMEGLSFREYLNFSQGLTIPTYSLDDIVAGNIELPEQVKHPLPLFKEYMQRGYYPFFGEDNYLIRLNNVITQTLETDIPIFARMNMSTAVKLKKLLYVVSRSVPFKPNLTEIGRAIETDRGTVADYLLYMEKAGLIRQLRICDEGMKLLEKTDKIYLANTNLVFSQADDKPEVGNLRETVFFSSLAVNNTVASAPSGDFSVGDYTFEVGGRNKTGRQIKEVPNSYIVKDDIERKGWRELPLWSFGFNY
jgi:predicted AAA+ superfamily ATPase